MLDYNQYINFDLLRAPTNKLEAVAVLTTGPESKKLKKHFTNQLDNLSNKDKEIASTIDLLFFINKQKPNFFDVKKLSTIFKKVLYIHIDIPKNQDFYFSNITNEIFTNDYNFDYGYKSGPNYSFFRIIELLEQYNTCLFLETDCFLREGWIEKVKNFCEHANGFWISGSKYNGSVVCNTDPMKLISTHLNGGVCLYATGDIFFQQFVKLYEEFLIISIKEAMNYPYDYIIPIMINTYQILNYDKNCQAFCKFVEKMYRDNNIISNYSTNQDVKTDINQIYRLFNSYIVHKKPFQYQRFTQHD